MVACFDCGRQTHFVQPLGDHLPVYCLGCLFELRARIVKDLDEQGHLEAYRTAVLPSRGRRPSDAMESSEAVRVPVAIAGA